ncbi:MAG: acyl-CoA dehydrogenase family protein, partial [Alphaproteobacteria bacterium]|nr:acyl-CoA dehydrogenase family protein [Alphaproteobacteria bacterium]
MTADTLHDAEDPQITQIRQSVTSLCSNFPGEYWREMDQKREYPTAFVKALTEAGFLAVLIPEEYGGSGLGL